MVDIFFNISSQTGNLLLLRGVLQGEGNGGQFPYPPVFESTGTKTNR